MKPTILVPIERSLSKGETIQVRTGSHWIVNVRSICSAGAIAAVGVAVMLEAFGTTEARARGMALFAATMFAIAIAILAVVTIQRRARVVLVTDRRIVAMTGVLRKSSTETLLSSVQSIDLDQSVFGRLLNFGTITLHTMGKEPMVLNDIAFPLELHQALQDHRPVRREFTSEAEDYAAGA